MAKKVAEEEALSTTLAVVSKKPLNDWADSVKDNYDFSHNIVFFYRKQYLLFCIISISISISQLAKQQHE